ncbi:MAG: translation initiation factor IF-2 N-terminal domain-containing protein, partial [Candidatus Korobacteraceae bacterium]
MQKIRINDLARELEVKSKMILDALIKVGVTEKKTHSSSIEVDEAERVKKYFAEHAEAGSSRASSRASAEEFKPKLDLSHISKPGDVLKAITQRAAQPSAVARPAAGPPPPTGPRQTIAP